MLPNQVTYLSLIPIQIPVIQPSTYPIQVPTQVTYPSTCTQVPVHVPMIQGTSPQPLATSDGEEILPNTGFSSKTESIKVTWTCA